MQGNLTTIEKGTRAEALILAHLAEAGYTVLVPFGVARYDLAIDPGDGSGIKTVQCKLGHLRNGAVRWSTSSSVSRFSGSNPGSRRVTYRGVVDYFGVWCPENNKAYLVPPGKVGRRDGYLCVDSVPRSKAKATVEWADDYEVRRLGPDWVPRSGQTSTNTGDSLF